MGAAEVYTTRKKIGNSLSSDLTLLKRLIQDLDSISPERGKEEKQLPILKNNSMWLKKAANLISFCAAGINTINRTVILTNLMQISGYLNIHNIDEFKDSPNFKKLFSIKKSLEVMQVNTELYKQQIERDPNF